MINLLDKIAICDGSCLSNPGRGGWCYIVIKDSKKIIKSGYAKESTNNIMELTALINCIKSENVDVIYSDSAYVVNGFNEWMHSWAKKQWCNSSKKEIKNIELWKELFSLYSTKLTVKWIKGHALLKHNDPLEPLYKIQHEADQFAKIAAEKQASYDAEVYGE